MFHFYIYRRDEFRGHYHRRSNVESTFCMIKRNFGAKVRSKTVTAQLNEVLCKVLAQNLLLPRSVHV
jgi:transposase